MKRQDILENPAKIVFLSLGSNLGNKKRNIELAKFKLNNADIKIIKSSKNYETLAWPDKKKPKFVNTALKVQTNLSPKKLMRKCLQIEKELGRFRKLKNEPRICDIDIIDYERKILSNIKKTNIFLPHPKMHKRSFVLLPLYEITKSWIHPVKKKSIKNLINSLDIEDLRTVKII